MHLRPACNLGVGWIHRSRDRVKRPFGIAPQLPLHRRHDEPREWGTAPKMELQPILPAHALCGARRVVGTDTTDQSGSGYPLRQLVGAGEGVRAAAPGPADDVRMACEPQRCRLLPPRRVADRGSCRSGWKSKSRRLQAGQGQRCDARLPSPQRRRIRALGESQDGRGSRSRARRPAFQYSAKPRCRPSRSVSVRPEFAVIRESRVSCGVDGELDASDVLLTVLPN